MENDLPGILRKEFSEKTLLESEVRVIDTWPYVHGSADKEIKSKIWLEREDEGPRIEKAIGDLKDKQRLIISWFLTAAIGVIGNLLINLFFGPANFGVLNSFEGKFPVVFVTIVLLALIFSLFLYIPLDLNYHFLFIAPLNLPSSSFNPQVNEEKLSPEAKKPTKLQGLDQTLTEFSGLVTLAILRDELAEFQGQRLMVKTIFRTFLENIANLKCARDEKLSAGTCPLHTRPRLSMPFLWRVSAFGKQAILAPYRNEAEDL